MPRDELNVIQGTLDLLVLHALAEAPLHGYAVARWVRARTDGVLAIEDGALYTALHRMEKRGLLSAEWGVSENNRKAKYYGLTRKGRRRLESERTAWLRYAEAVYKVVTPPGQA
jgi:PadR family transcriptional regulator, regulatory protein PadR